MQARLAIAPMLEPLQHAECTVFQPPYVGMAKVEERGLSWTQTARSDRAWRSRSGLANDD